MNKFLLKTISIVGFLTLLGAGCQPALQKPIGKNNPSKKIADVRGFGKLPKPGEISNSAVAGTDLGGRSSVSAIAPKPLGMAPLNAPMAEAAQTEPAVLDKRMPIPPPPPTPIKVDYKLEGALPSWPSEDKVLRYKDIAYPSSNLTALAAATGLPTQALGANAELQNFNFSWRDSDKLQWNFDATNRSVNFWRQEDNYRIMADNRGDGTPPKINDEEMIRIATDFLNQHGFGKLQHGPAVVEKPWGDQPVGQTYPCPVTLEKSEAAVTSNVAPDSVSAGSVGVGSAAPGTSMIAPCWFPYNQVTVYFDAVNEGRSIHDLNGWPFRSIYITINVKDKQVVNGNIWLDRDSEASKYKLISKEDAQKKLQNGGRNPIWPWYGNEYDDRNIDVRIEKIELAWMRYDVWVENKNETYLVPALAATGKVEYSKDRIEPYRTIVPLVADEAFEEVAPPQPVPMPAFKGAPEAIEAVPSSNR